MLPLSCDTRKMAIGKIEKHHHPLIKPLGSLSLNFCHQMTTTGTQRFRLF